MSLSTHALRWVSGFCLAIALLAPIASPAAQVGMVLDVQGEGRLEADGKSAPLQLLSYLDAGSRVTLADGARASLSIYPTRMMYQLKGPAVATVSASGLTLVSGEAPVQVSMAQKLVAAAQASDHVHGAYRMRNAADTAIALVIPENDSLLLAPPAAFEWDAVSPGGFDIVVTQAGDPSAIVARGQVDAMRWEWPADKPLPPGDYAWSVSQAAASDGSTVSTRGTFRLATAEEASDIESLRPAQDAPVEAWVLYASTLQAKRLRGPAREAWKHVATLRPDLRTARQLSR